jgi:RES domain-containing protein
VNNTVYRIVKTKWVSSAFDGEGARKYPGRWNSRGTSMIYTASSEALATLEILVHYESEQLIRDHFVIVPLVIPSTCILQLGDDLPDDWDAQPAPTSTRTIGDNWIKDNASAALAVPSVVVPREKNYLINPNHADFKNISILDPQPLNLDSRLTN